MKAARLPLLSSLKNDVTGRMAGRRIDLDEVVEPVRAAADEVGTAVFENRHDALPERAELRRSFLGIGVDLREVVDVRLGEHVARIGKCRHPFAVLLLRVPADMIVMQVRAHHQIDFLRPRAGGG